MFNAKKVVCNQTPFVPEERRIILFMSDTWSSTREGIASVNYTLLCRLARFKGISLVCTVLEHKSAISKADREEAKELRIRLVYPRCVKDKCKINYLFEAVNELPHVVYPSLSLASRNVTHIVGHCPVTSLAAINLKRAIYRNASVVQLYHVHPLKLLWLKTDLPFNLPNEEAAEEYARVSDVVFCVNKEIYLYLKTVFQSKSCSDAKAVDIRLFYPRCHERIFETKRARIDWRKRGDELKMMVIDDGYGESAWGGMNIAACTTDKMTLKTIRRRGKIIKKPSSITSLNIVKCDNVINADETLDAILPWVRNEDAEIKVSIHRNPKTFFTEMFDADVCLYPYRSEPFGSIGLLPITAGVPTLISTQCFNKSILESKLEEPNFFLATTELSKLSVRQDANTWRERIKDIMSDPMETHHRAMVLRTAIRRDEDSKRSYENFVSCCLGGIRLKHESTLITLDDEADPIKELFIRREFNRFLCQVMKQCWRLKNDRLTRYRDLPELLPGITLPLTELIKNVTNFIESMDREIVEVDSNSLAFVVYCPSLASLWDLWSSCDKINTVFSNTLFPADKESDILPFFSIKKATIQTVIDGPEFLKYRRSPHFSRPSHYGDSHAELNH